jgi:hypothetical protein
VDNSSGSPPRGSSPSQTEASDPTKRNGIPRSKRKLKVYRGLDNGAYIASESTSPRVARTPSGTWRTSAHHATHRRTTCCGSNGTGYILDSLV